MKYITSILSCLICIQLFAGCSKSNQVTSDTNDVSDTESMKLKITIGTNTFTATLNNNPSATAFKARLPLTINMEELNANEKYFDFAYSLPANASNPGTIQSGDIMLYGANTLVVFYKSFSTSFSYTRLGRVDDTSGLAAALGIGNVTVTIALQ